MPDSRAVKDAMDTGCMLAEACKSGKRREKKDVRGEEMKLPGIESMNEIFCELLNDGAVRATKYFSDKQIIRAVRRRYRGKILKSSNIEVLFTFGRPNFEEREFIKRCKKLKKDFTAENQVKYLIKKK